MKYYAIKFSLIIKYFMQFSIRLHFTAGIYDMTLFIQYTFYHIVSYRMVYVKILDSKIDI